MSAMDARPKLALAPELAPASDAPRIKVAYIGGLGRSGSTLLDRMLGQLPGFLSAGEIRDLWQRGLVENRLCGCGTAFRQCPFWSAVGQEAFGGWDRVDVAHVLALSRSIDRHSRIPLLVAHSAWPPFDRRLRELLGILERLYRAIAVVGDTRVVVDSSKAPSTAFVLRAIPALDLRLVHLIRDSRGVAYSWNKKVVRPDTPGRTVYMHRYQPARIGMRWVTRNLQMEMLGRLGLPEVRVRYEHAVTAPRLELERIVEMLDERIDPEAFAFIAGDRVRLGVNHTVMGNPVRMHQGSLQLRLDDEWRSAMSPRQRRIVSLLSRPLLRRYGYQP
jgi:hypothetical protein